jgi:membrane protein YqaA with SNARE-associated domain
MKHKKPTIIRLIDKVLLLLLVFFLIMFTYAYFESDIIIFLEQNPWISDYYSYFYTEISTGTFVGIFYISFIATIFFLFIPIEGVILAYSLSGVNPFLILGAYTIGSFCGITLNYWIGFFIGEFGLRKLLKDKHESYQAKVEKYGGVGLFVFNVLPMPEVINAVYGGFRYSYFKFVAIAISGKILKCCFIVFLYDYIAQYVAELIADLFN